MTFDQEIKELYPVLRTYAIQLARDKVRGEDLLHETLPHVRAASGIKDMLQYTKRAIWLGWFSKTSPYRRTYHLPATDLPPDLPEDTTTTPATLPDNILTNLRGFDKELFEMYLMPGFSLKTVSELTGISTNDLSQSIHRSKNKLKQYVRSESCAR